MRLLPWGPRRQESVHDYAGILVPLEEAHLHSHSARSGKSEFEEPPGEYDPATVEDGMHDPADKDDEDEGTGMLQMSAAEYTIEGLRREIRKGGERGQQWTSYELKSKLINKAIQDIGMGRYNWQLFVLCGFGWFADK